MDTRFISLKSALYFHSEQIKEHGGSHGVRDMHLLNSALAQPEMGFGNEYLHKTIFDKAAAYGFHICQNHPFIDGNKRTAFLLMDIFLMANGYIITALKENKYSIMIDLASGKLSKTELAKWLGSNTTPL